MTPASRTAQQPSFGRIFIFNYYGVWPFISFIAPACPHATKLALQAPQTHANSIRMQWTMAICIPQVSWWCEMREHISSTAKFVGKLIFSFQLAEHNGWRIIEHASEQVVTPAMRHTHNHLLDAFLWALRKDLVEECHHRFGSFAAITLQSKRYGWNIKRMLLSLS